MQKRTSNSSAKPSTKCLRCRKRRLQCDKTLPACNTCVAAGETCPGYVKPLRWSQKHEVLKKQEKTRDADSPAVIDNGQESIDVDSNPVQCGTSSGHEPELGNRMTVPPIDHSIHEELSPPLPEWMQIAMPGFDELVLQQASVDGFGLPLSEMCAPDSFSHWPLQLEPEDLVPTQSSGESSSRASNHSRRSVERSNNNTRSARRPPVQKPATGTPGSLLHTFYRLSQPTAVSGFAEDDFVNYYFKHVARLFSCFDTRMNPFRAMVADCWRSSRTVSLAIQSMAIAHLSNWYPYMAALGLGKRKQAWKLLQYDLKRTGSGESHCSDHEMLGLLLLGFSSSWHINSNLGLQFLTIARNLIKYRLQYGTGKTSPHQAFFEEALLYWEMLTSFVDPVPMTCFPGHGMPELQTVQMTGPKQPHAWTGISTELHYAFAEIGRLLRRQKSTSGHLDITDPLEVQFAEKLDEYLTAVQLPTEEQIADLADPTTSKQDLIRCAVAYRNISLMELFGIFPLLLDARLSNGSESDGLSAPVRVEANLTSDQKRDEWFLSVANQSLELLQQVSIASAACRLQPILLVSIAGQMRLDRDIPECSQSPEESLYDDSDSWKNVDHNRWFIEARMLALSKKFPQKPFLRMIDIMKEVWNRLDSGIDSHWMDVVNDKGWYTIMG